MKMKQNIYDRHDILNKKNELSTDEKNELLYLETLKSISELENEIAFLRQKINNANGFEKFTLETSPNEFEEFEQVSSGFEKEGNKLNKLESKLRKKQIFVRDYEVDKSNKSHLLDSKKSDVQIKKDIKEYSSIPIFDDNIVELQNNKLHKVLREFKIYRIYFNLFRTEFVGLYHIIPIHFLVFIQNMLKNKNKFDIGKKTVSLSALIMGNSSSGKSATVKFHTRLAKELGVMVSNIENSTAANAIGSIENDQKTTYDYTITKGLISGGMIFIEELKTMLKKANSNQEIETILFDVIEGDEVVSGLKSAALSTQRYIKWKKAMEVAKSIDDKEELRKLEALDLKCSDDYYYMDLENQRVIFKNNAGVVAYSQPIDIHSSNSEKGLQKEKGLDQGLYNRFLFEWYIDNNSSEDEMRLDKEKTIWLEKMENFYKTPNNKLYDSFLKEFKKEFQSLPKGLLKYNEIYMGKIRTEFLKNRDPKINDIIDNRNKIGKKAQYLKSYADRAKWNLSINISYLLAYLEGLEAPSEQNVKVTSDILNEVLLKYYNYLESVLNDTKKKTIEEQEYARIAIDEIINYFSESSKRNLLDIYDKYPNKTYVKETVKSKFIIIHGKLNWEDKKFETMLKSVEDLKLIKLLKSNPVSGKNFNKNASKIVLTNKYKKFEVLSNIEDIVKIKEEFKRW